MRTRLALGAALLIGIGAAQAQAPVTLVVPFAAGGPSDIITRIVAAELGPALGTQVAVKNTTGASGTIAAAEVARARPDGLTLLSSPSGPIAIQPQLMRGVAYAIADFKPICLLAEAPVFMMTPATSGLRTVSDVAARARAAGGAMPYGSSGFGTLPHISMVAWTRAAGVGMNHVPFRGAGDVMLAFQQGTVSILSDLATVVHQQGLHPIAVYAPARTAEFPDTPTMREAGYDLEFSNWQGIFAPAGVAAPVLARLEAACAAAMRSRGVAEGLSRANTPARFLGAGDFAVFIAAEVGKYRAIIEATGLRQAE